MNYRECDKEKVDPISVKWYKDTVNDRNVNIKPHRKTGFDDTTTDAVQSANIVEEIRYPIMVKASDSDNILDEKMSVR
jgi:hypothetical protein